MEILDPGRVGFLMRWRGTVTVGAPGAGREAGAPPAVLGLMATVEVLPDTFQGVPPEAGRGHPTALHGLSRGAPLCHGHLGPARYRKTSCRRMSKVIRVLRRVLSLVLLGFKRL